MSYEKGTYSAQIVGSIEAGRSTGPSNLRNLGRLLVGGGIPVIAAGLSVQVDRGGFGGCGEAGGGGGRFREILHFLGWDVGTVLGGIEIGGTRGRLDLIGLTISSLSERLIANVRWKGEALARETGIDLRSLHLSVAPRQLHPSPL